MATIRDVAVLAGVSTATVSYSLNKPGRVTPELRARVEDAVRMLDYRPDGAARALRTRRSNLVSLIVPDVANHYYAAVARGVSDAIKERQLHVVLGNTDALPDEELSFLRSVGMQRAAGAVIVPFRLAGDALRNARPTDVPIVLLAAPEFAGDFPCIYPDDLGGAREAVAYILASGRRRIAMIGGLPDTPPTVRRYRGYLQAHADAGITPDPSLLAFSDFRRGGGEVAMQTLLDGPPFDALFAVNDLVAIGAMRVARHCGLRVPKDLAVVGFDDIDEAEIVEPPLTTVRQPSYETGRICGALLLDLLDGRDDMTRQQMLACTLIRRASA